jgi:hypothetical protein
MKEFIRADIVNSNLSDQNPRMVSINYETIWEIEAPIMFRPLIFRIFIFLIQFTELAGIAMTLRYFIFPTLQSEGSLLRNRLVLLTFLFSLDYSVNRIDYFLHSENFRAGVERQITDAKPRIKEKIIGWAEDKKIVFIKQYL